MIVKVSVIMSNYNGLSLGLIEKSLSSILKNKYPNIEIILVDNASTDDSVDFIKKKFGKNPKLKLIQNPVNMYSQGLNLGIKNSKGEYIAFFNNDATVSNGYFQEFIKFLDKNKDIALAQGKLLSSSNSSLIDSAGETMDIYGNPQSIGNGKKSLGNYEEMCELLSVSGSCSILRRSCIEKIGYFDDSYGIGYEDMDLSLRAWERGFRVVYYPMVRVSHERGATDLAPIVRVKVRWHFNKNRIQTIIKHYPVPLMIRSLIGVGIIYVSMGLFEILIKRNFKLGFTRFTSIGWVILNLPRIIEERRLINKKTSVEKRKKMFDLFLKRSFLQSIFLFIKIT